MKPASPAIWATSTADTRVATLPLLGAAVRRRGSLRVVEVGIEELTYGRHVRTTTHPHTLHNHSSTSSSCLQQAVAEEEARAASSNRPTLVDNNNQPLIPELSAHLKLTATTPIGHLALAAFDTVGFTVAERAARGATPAAAADRTIEKAICAVVAQLNHAQSSVCCEVKVAARGDLTIGRSTWVETRSLNS
jgi:hypothetical protein